MNAGLPLLPDEFVQTSLQRPNKFISYAIQSNQFSKNNLYCFDSGDTPFDSPKIQLRALKKMNEDEIRI